MKHVFLDDNYDQGHYLMHDLEQHPDCHVIYKDRLHQNAAFNAFFCSHIFRKIKRHFRMPFRRLAYKMILRPYCDEDTQTITMTTSWYCKKIVDFIKKHYPQVKLVLLIRDTVQDNTRRNKEFQIEKVKD